MYTAGARRREFTVVGVFVSEPDKYAFAEIYDSQRAFYRPESLEKSVGTTRARTIILNSRPE